MTDLTNQWLPENCQELTVSNKAPCSPRPPKAEPFLHNWEGKLIGWQNGYEFRQFLGNCYAFLGEELSRLDGMQQLVHHYYLQNGMLSALNAAKAIKKFLGHSSE